ncbi:MAG: leucine-rich repeat protein, partial [Oscillospiraceae bacterium]|nr:leucine-rich repeat protein [Oscillospiraceae bacterium]
MRGKRMLCLCLALALIFCLFPAADAAAVSAQGSSGSCGWVLESKAVLSDGSTGACLTVSPDGDAGYMEPAAFSDDKNLAPYAESIPDIRQVEIKSGVQNIGADFLHYFGSFDLKYIIIADSVREIGDSAFCANGYRHSLEVAWGKGIESVGENAFFFTGLSSVKLLNVKTIGSGAFYLCGELTTADLGSKLSSIGRNAFGACQKLRTVYIPDTLREIGPYAFSSCGSLTDVYYSGTGDQWSELKDRCKGSGNDELFNARIHYRYNLSYNISVIGGRADRETAKAGETVNLEAPEKDGYTFSGWKDISGGAVFADRRSSKTSFVMPAYDVNVEAVYTPLSYRVTVSGGTADKTEAKTGETVNVSALPYSGSYSFSGWESVSGGAVLADSLSAATTFVMPANDVCISGNYSYHSYMKNPFIDVYSGDYFYGPVMWAYFASPQVTNGIDSVRFGPSQTVTRGQ